MKDDAEDSASIGIVTSSVQNGLSPSDSPSVSHPIMKTVGRVRSQSQSGFSACAVVPGMLISPHSRLRPSKKAASFPAARFTIPRPSEKAARRIT